MKLRNIIESYDGLPDEDQFVNPASVCARCQTDITEYFDMPETDDRLARAWYITYPNSGFALGPLRYGEMVTGEVAAEDSKERDGCYPDELWPDGHTEECEPYTYMTSVPCENFECSECGQMCPRCYDIHDCTFEESYEGLPDEDEFGDDETPPYVQGLQNWLEQVGAVPVVHYSSIPNNQKAGGVPCRTSGQLIQYFAGEEDVTNIVINHPAFESHKAGIPGSSEPKVSILTPYIDDDIPWSVSWYYQTSYQGEPLDDNWEAHQ
jgi:hypothetical protein